MTHASISRKEEKGSRIVVRVRPTAKGDPDLQPRGFLLQCHDLVEDLLARVFHGVEFKAFRLYVRKSHVEVADGVCGNPVRIPLWACEIVLALHLMYPSRKIDQRLTATLSIGCPCFVVPGYS